MSGSQVEQASLFPLPPRFPDFRRCRCACDCGRWWYSPRVKGRPPKYSTPECYRKVRNAKRREWSAQDGTRQRGGPEHIGTVLDRALAQVKEGRR